MNQPILNIILTDDDDDDRLFFSEVLDEIELQTSLSLFKNGEELMEYLLKPTNVFPNIIFLDLNMPKKTACNVCVKLEAIPYFKTCLLQFIQRLLLKRILKTLLQTEQIFI